MHPNTIKDRNAITDHVSDYMHDNCPSWSVDTLLTHPKDAMLMGVVVGMTAGRIRPKVGKALVMFLANLERDEADTLRVVDEICRTALSARKRGDLKRDPV